MARWNDVAYADVAAPGIANDNDYLGPWSGEAAVERELARQAAENEALAAKNEEERAATLARSRREQQSGSQMPGVGSFQNMGASGAAAPGIGGWGAGGASAGGWNAGGAAAGGWNAGGAASQGGGALSSAFSNPYTWIAALAIGNEFNAEHEGRRENDSFPGKSALLGRSLYEDKDHLREQGNKIIPGLGEDINIAGNFSSPLDLFDGDTWESAWDSLKSGGPGIGLLKKVF